VSCDAVRGVGAAFAAPESDKESADAERRTDNEAADEATCEDDATDDTTQERPNR